MAGRVAGRVTAGNGLRGYSVAEEGLMVRVAVIGTLSGEGEGEEGD